VIGAARVEQIRIGMRNRARAILVVGAVLAGTMLTAPAGAAGLEVLQREQHGFVAPGRGEVLPERPQFDATGALAWPGPQRPSGSADCTSAQWRIWQVEPRIEEWRCSATAGALLRIDMPDRERWRHRLGEGGPDARVAGVDPSGLLLDTLWRVDGETGAAEDLIVAHPARRSLWAAAPIAVDGASLYTALAPSGTFRRGAIVRLDRSNGQQHEVAQLPRRGLLSRWQARDLAVSADGRWLFAALQEDWRGPSRVALAVLDLHRGTWRAIDEHCVDSHCSQPRVVRDGDALGFGFRELRSAQVMLIRYRWLPD
jgi:hypothetical protein